jgi:CBS domain-containing membrane protein
MVTTKVSQIMSRNVESLKIGESVALARDIMGLGRIRHLPVVDGEGYLVGLVTHRLLLSAWLGHGRPASEKPRSIDDEVPVEMLMDKNIRTVTPSTPAEIAARLMEEHKYGCLPVVQSEDDAKLVGILTEADFVRFARRYFEDQAG